MTEDSFLTEEEVLILSYLAENSEEDCETILELIEELKWLRVRSESSSVDSDEDRREESGEEEEEFNSDLSSQDREETEPPPLESEIKVDGEILTFEIKI